MKVYSREWVRVLLYSMLIVPTVYLYAAFYVAMIFLNNYREAVATDSRFKRWWKASLYPVGAVFLFLDGLYDLICGSIWFRKWAEWGVRNKTFTARLKYYKKQHEEMVSNLRYDADIVARYELAIKFCTLINKVAPAHC